MSFKSRKTGGSSIRSRATASKYIRGGYKRPSKGSSTRPGIIGNRPVKSRQPSTIGKGGGRYPKHVDVRRERAGGRVIEAVRKTRTGYTAYDGEKQKPLSKGQLKNYRGITANREPRTIAVRSSGSSRILRKPKGKALPKPDPIQKIKAAKKVAKSSGIITTKFGSVKPKKETKTKIAKISKLYTKKAKSVAKVKRKNINKPKTSKIRRAKLKVPTRKKFDYSL